MQKNAIRRPENFRIATVVTAMNVTPLMRRVTVQVDDLTQFDCSSRTLGPHVHALIPREDMAEQEWPTADEQGRAIYPPLDRRPALRTYSVRRFDYKANTIDIDFVLHGDEGVASRWAVRAVPGEEIGLWRPHARMLEQEPQRYILAGDHTALPAIAFILDHLPDNADGNVFIEIPDPLERQELRVPAGMNLEWLYSNERGSAASRLPDAIRALDRKKIAGSFVWAGAEAGIARDIRRFARHECGLSTQDIYILNYWKRGAVEGTYEHGE